MMRKVIKMKNIFKYSLAVFFGGLFFMQFSLAQTPFRVGTTAFNFLEYGYGSAGTSMGDAYVSLAKDITSIYWNPAGLAFMERDELNLTMQPWVAGIESSFFGLGIKLGSVGTIAVSMISVNYGDMDVTTLDQQDGTGEIFSSSDYAISVAFARQITDWFAFGLAGKYSASQIWHMEASGLSIDLGAQVHTGFFSQTGKREDGLNIGMSISNYGSRVKYSGLDSWYPIDVDPYGNGNYENVKGEFFMEEWELPLLFRIGISYPFINTKYHKITLAMDALHPNNNSESINVGGEYNFTTPTFGSLFLRAGYKGLLMSESEYGFSAGGGLIYNLMNNVGLKIEYSYRSIGLLGDTYSYGFGVLF